MGSVISDGIECPRCNESKGVLEVYYKNYEVYFCCQTTECNFKYSYKWKRDRNNKLITKDGTDNFQFQNLIMVETVFEKGKRIIKEIKDYI
jgi:hypothetical protein